MESFFMTILALSLRILNVYTFIFFYSSLIPENTECLHFQLLIQYIWKTECLHFQLLSTYPWEYWMFTLLITNDLFLRILNVYTFNYSSDIPEKLNVYTFNYLVLIPENTECLHFLILYPWKTECLHFQLLIRYPWKTECLHF